MNTERRRGPVRSEASRMAILQATANQFEKLGYDHLTMEGIAAEAKVGKQTIYRWWPSRSALIADCLVEGLIIPEWFVPVDSGDLRADLVAWLTRIFEFLGQPGNTTLLRSLVVAAAENEEVAMHLNDRLGVQSLFGDRLAASASPAADEPRAVGGDGRPGGGSDGTGRRSGSGGESHAIGSESHAIGRGSDGTGRGSEGTGRRSGSGGESHAIGSESHAASGPNPAGRGPHPTEIGEALLGAVVLRNLRRGPLDAEFAERLVDTVLGPAR